MTTERWEIDLSHSGIHFSVRHLMVARVRGQFTRWGGSLLVPDGDFNRATVEAVIDATSIDTRVAPRDNHLRSADFLDVADYPEITFRAVRVKPESKEHLQVMGALTIRGVTREVTLAVEGSGVTRDTTGTARAVFSAKASFDRRDFGLNWNQALEAGGVLVGERIDVEIEVQAMPQSAARAA